MQNRIKFLEDKILKHKELYYNGNAIISDFEYDKLESELKLLKPDSFVLNFVGSDTAKQKNTKKFQHKYKVLSLDKIQNDINQLIKFANYNTVIFTEKIDGSNISLYYDIETKQFKNAVTRGNGIIGESVTEHFNYIENFPKQLKNNIEIVYGECCITFDNYEQLKIEMRHRNLPEPSSIRNIVAGLLHRKDNIDLCKYLTFIAHNLYCEFDIKHELDKFKLLKNNNFLIPNFDLCYKSVNDNIEYENNIKLIIESFKNNKPNYLTDGIVISYDNIEFQKSLGYTEHHPKGKIAFKFESETAQTKVNNIIYKVNRTGKISFIAEIEPVYLSGANINNVTLHNIDYIKTNQIGINSIIEITRSNEIIPKHLKTIVPAEYNEPETCPSCGSILYKSSTNIDLFCKNLHCIDKSVLQLLHFIKCIGVEFIDETTLRKLKLYSIQDFLEFFNDAENFKFNSEVSELILNKIKQTIPVSISKDILLTALGIDSVGKKIANDIEQYIDLENYCVLDAIHGIDGVGEVIINNIKEYLKITQNQQTIQYILNNIQIVSKQIISNTNSKISNLTFCITGTLSKPRNEIEKIITDNNGKILNSVSKKLNYLVTNDIESNSSKFIKAKSLGISIINESELEQMLL